MLRGDDVNELQRRLNALGFDAGRQDGILGPETEPALRQFQRERGIEPDGVCGPATINALMSVGTLAAGSVAVGARARNAATRRPPSARPPRVPRRRPGPRRARRRRRAAGSSTRARSVAIDTSGDDHSVLAAQANAFGADVCVAFVSGTDLGARCAYFANQTFRSEAGFCLAHGIDGTAPHRASRGRRTGGPNLPAAARHPDGRGRVRPVLARRAGRRGARSRPACRMSLARSRVAFVRASNSRSTRVDRPRARARSASAVRRPSVMIR